MNNEYRIKLISNYELIDLEDCGVIENKMVENDDAIFLEDTAYDIIKRFLDGYCFSEVINFIIDKYEVSLQQVSFDVNELIEQLSQKHVVEVYYD